MSRVHPGLTLSSLLAALAATVSFGCSKAPENTVDAVSESRLTDLEGKVRDLAAENEEARRALGVTGHERGTLTKAVGDLREELARLRAEVAGRGGAAAMSDGASSGASSPGSTSGSTSFPSTTSGGALAGGTGTPDDSYSPTTAEVDRADALMKAVEKRRQEEAEKKRLKDVLTQAEITLTPDQEATVLKLNREYSDKRNELLKTLGSRQRGVPQTDADRNEFRAKIEELQSQHEADLRAALPSSDAERVIAAVKQSYPGFFRRDRSERPMRTGMGGN